MKRSKLGVRGFVGLLCMTAAVGLSPVGFNLIVDPFAMNRWFDLGLNREEVSLKAHYPLWKMIEYPRVGGRHVLLGDSRTRALQDRYWREYAFDGSYNFAYGGSTVQEIYATFQYLKIEADLETLIIGVPLRTFNRDHRGGLNRVPEAIALANDPLAYYASWFVAKSGWANLKAANPSGLAALRELLPDLVAQARAAERSEATAWRLTDLLAPDLCRACVLPVARGAATPAALRQFYGLGLGRWASVWPTIVSDRNLPGKFAKQVQNNARSDWRGFTFSEELWALIVEIAEWSHANDVRLIFLIPPTIVEMQERISAFGLGDLNHSFRHRLATLAPVIDLDFDSALTRDISRFKDAYHFDSSVSRPLIRELLRLLGRPSEMKKKSSRDLADVVCPIFEADVLRRVADDELVMTEGRNCRLWRAAGA